MYNWLCHKDKLIFLFLFSEGNGTFILLVYVSAAMQTLHDIKHWK